MKVLRIHDAQLKTKAREDFRFYISNRADKPVSLPMGFAVGIVEPCEGLVKELPRGCVPRPGEGADSDAALDPAPAATKATEPPSKAQAPAAERAANSAKEPEKEEAPPMLRVAHEESPKVLRQEIKALQEEQEYLSGRQERKLDITPHRMEVTEEARPFMLHPSRTGENALLRIAQLMVQQTTPGVSELSQSEWFFPVVIVRKSDGTAWFCVDYGGLN